MPTIDSRTVTVFDGRLHDASLGVVKLEPNAGVDGDAIVIGSWHSSPDRVRTYTEVSSENLADVELEIYRAMQGTTVTIVDQFGDQWDDVVVMAVVAEKAPKVGFGNVYVVEARWVFLTAVEVP